MPSGKSFARSGGGEAVAIIHATASPTHDVDDVRVRLIHDVKDRGQNSTKVTIEQKWNNIKQNSTPKDAPGRQVGVAPAPF
jgi:hypothetical protein